MAELNEYTHPDRDFYSQSRWMLTANAISHGFALGVYCVVPWMSIAEYGLMATLLQIVNLMVIPGMGLQAIFAQDAAASTRLSEHQRLAHTASTLLAATGFLWLAGIAVAALFRSEIYAWLKIAYPASFWITMLLGLVQLWLSITTGLLQGRQSFLWLGWSLITNGVGRFVSVVVILAAFGGQASGAMAGIFCGACAAFLISGWHSRRDWARKPAAFPWMSWLKRIAPLTIGLGSCQFMLCGDMLFARHLFAANLTGLYSLAGMVARGLVILSGAVTTVMFPKIVRSFARSVPTNAFSKSLRLTVIFALTASTFITLVCICAPSLFDFFIRSGLPVATGYGTLLSLHRNSALLVAQLTSWFVWAMLPLAVSNVMVAVVIARRSYTRLTGLALVALAYALAMAAFEGSPAGLIRMTGGFNLFFCAVSAAMLVRKNSGVRADARGPVPRTPCPVCTSTSSGLVGRGFPGYVQGTAYEIYRCRECNTSYIAGGNGAATTAELYDAIHSAASCAGYDRYSTYAARVLQEKDPLSFLAAREAGYSAVEEYLRNRKGLRILDVGCGLGYLSYAMGRRGFEVCGIDLSEAALQTARERYGPLFECIDAGEFARTSSQRYDLIVALEWIEHVPDAVGSLGDLTRLLAPGGSVIVSTPNREFCGRASIWHTDLPPVHRVWLSRKGLDKIAGRIGCECRFRTFSDCYPDHENKLARYLGYRMTRDTRPRMTHGMNPVAAGTRGRFPLRTWANRVLHEVKPVRDFCNWLHNRFVRRDETLVAILTKRTSAEVSN